MADVAAFVLARLAEDEADADRVHDIECDIHRGFADERGDCDCGEPARVLAQVAALRAIVELHKPVEDGMGYHSDGGYGAVDLACSTCGTYDEYAEAWPCLTLLALAGIWKDHPDYDPAWGEAR